MEQLGNITYVKYDLKKPEFPLEVKDMNKINILVGANGTGKTLHLALTWCINILVDAKYRYNWKNEEAYRVMCENIFKYSFKDLDIDGEITARYEDNLEFNIKFSEGIVTDVTVDKKKDSIRVNSGAIFLSKDTRLLSNITRYIKFKELIMGTDKIKFSSFYKPSKELEVLLGMYKTYDVLFMEGFIDTFKDKKKDIPAQIALMMSDNPKSEDYKQFYYNSSNQAFYIIDSKGVEKDAETMGSGEQSIIVMLMSSKFMS